MVATTRAAAVATPPPSAALDAAAAPAAGVLPPRSPRGDAAAARRLYAPPKGDGPALLAAALALGGWSAAMAHGLFGVRLPPALGGGAPIGAPSSPSSSAGSFSPWWDVLLTFAAVEFASTALFITAHDAMHGAVCRKRRWLNDAVGRTCLSLYAWFDYGLLYEKHWEHHNHTGLVGGDPDFHGGDPNFFKWFARFMITYSRPGQYVRIVAWVFFLQALGAPYGNVVLYVAAAPITAAVRLFYFGTYLPHLPPRVGGQRGETEEEIWARKEGGGSKGRKKKDDGGGGGRAEAATATATTTALLRRASDLLLGPARDGSAEMAWQLSHSTSAPPLVAFLSCLCFGYHWEHHRFPYAPWFDLPKVRALAAAHGLRRRCVDAYLSAAARDEVLEQQRRRGRGRGAAAAAGA